MPIGAANLGFWFREAIPPIPPPPPFEGKWDYILLEYYFEDPGRDLDTRSRFIVPASGTYNGWGWNQTASTNFGIWGGDNTGVGWEAFLILPNNILETAPQLPSLILDCRSMWYNTIGTTPVGLRVSLFNGGTMVKNGYTWENPTATDSKELLYIAKMITLYSRDDRDPGQRIGVFHYDLQNGGGYLDISDETDYPF